MVRCHGVHRRSTGSAALGASWPRGDEPKVLGAMDRIFAEEIARLVRQRAGKPGAATGSVAAPQMFGGSLNVHPHLHTPSADGVFADVTA